MNIQLATINQLDEIIEIFKDCKASLDLNKIYQGTDNYPNPEVIRNDILNGHLYGLFDQQTCPGVITINTHQDSQYHSILWKDTTANFLVVHRLAVSPTYQKQGFGKKLISFAEEFASLNNFNSIRLDAYSGNPDTLDFYEKRGYVKRGEVMFPQRELPFFCYEWG